MVEAAVLDHCGRQRRRMQNAAFLQKIHLGDNLTVVTENLLRKVGHRANNRANLCQRRCLHIVEC
eukprot:1586555-Prymnesium_polylepis.1